MVESRVGLRSICVRVQGDLVTARERWTKMFEMKAQREHLPCKWASRGSLLSGASNGVLQGQGQCSRQRKAFLVPRSLPAAGMGSGGRHSSWPLQLRIQTHWHDLVPWEMRVVSCTTHPPTSWERPPLEPSDPLRQKQGWGWGWKNRAQGAPR